MRCKSFDKGEVPCPEDATVEVFWPGKETIACDRHKEGMVKLAGFMGFAVAVRPLTDAQKAEA